MPLLQALKQGELKWANDLLNQQEIQAQITKDLSFSTQALELAAERGYKAIVEQLLKVLSTRNIRNIEESSKIESSYKKSFKKALENNHSAVVECLLKMKAVQDRVLTSHPCLICLQEFARREVDKGHSETVEYLLSVPAIREDAAKYWHLDILESAAENGLLEVVKIFLEIMRSRYSTKLLNDTFILAIKNGHLAVVEHLLKIEDVCKEIASRGNKALTAAAKNGHLAVVQRLLEIEEVGMNAALGYNNPIVEAVKNGHLAIAKLLLKVKTIRSDIAENPEFPLFSFL